VSFNVSATPTHFQISDCQPRCKFIVAAIAVIISTIIGSPLVRYSSHYNAPAVSGTRFSGLMCAILICSWTRVECCTVCCRRHFGVVKNKRCNVAFIPISIFHIKRIKSSIPPPFPVMSFDRRFDYFENLNISSSFDGCDKMPMRIIQFNVLLRYSRKQREHQQRLLPRAVRIVREHIVYRGSISDG